MGKKCTKCGLVKSETEFYKDKQKKSGYRPDCKVCNTKQSKKWANANKDKTRFHKLKYSTNVTKEQYLELLHLQNNKCAICNVSINDLDKNLSVDHCHEDNFVRGLLCSKCNFGLGYFNDNENLLLNAINYLKDNFKYKGIKFKE